MTAPDLFAQTRRPRYWVGVASKNHVARGVEGGFCQLCHGKPQPLKRMSPGDWIIYYSPKETFEGSTPLQAFTAIGQIVGEQVYVHEMAPGFVPYRRDVSYTVNARAVDIKLLLDCLSFIKDKQRWGYAFRFGHFEIPIDDFKTISQAMLR